jgi:hypothetical protein
MFLPSCERLATEQPTLASLLERLDQALADMGSAGEIVAADLAYVLEEDTDRIDAILGELVQLGGLERQERIFCPNGCHAITVEEYQQACDEGAAPRCPECDHRMEPSASTLRSVYVIREATIHTPRTSKRPTDGRSLAQGRPHKMLFAAANPDVNKLAIDAEWRRIEERFSKKKCRVEIERVDRWATTTDDFRQAVLDERPVIVHFSGHGKLHRGLNFADAAGGVRPVTGAALAGLFRLFNFVECVLLNACHSAEPAAVIAKHVHCVIAMQGEIGDESAIEFSAGFYDALTAGEPYGRCFDLALNAIDLANLTDVDCPTIWIDGIHYPVASPIA